MEETPDLEFYYHMLRPFVHYVPFSVKVPKPNYGHRDPARRQPRLDGVETNLSQVIQAAREDDEGSRRIAEQAHHFAHTHLCDAARHCYLYELLKRYGKAMTYTPSLEDRPDALRVTDDEDVVFFRRSRRAGVGAVPRMRGRG